MVARFQKYLCPNQLKVMIWLAFLCLYILAAGVVSRKLPWALERLLRKTIFTTTMFAWPNEPKRVYLLGSETRQTSPYTLFFSYGLVTYLWACIFVESFGTIVSSRKRVAKSRAHRRK